MQKFSLATDTVKYKPGQEIEIHASTTFDTEVTVLIRSNLTDLDNKHFVIPVGSTLVFKYAPKSPGFIQTSRVWGAVWDTSGFLDLRFETVQIETPSFVQPIVEQPMGISEPVEKIEYDVNGWANAELFKTVENDDQEFSFFLSEYDGAGYSIISNDSDFTVTSYVSFYQQNKSIVSVKQSDLFYLKLCLSIQFGGKNYELQGSSNLDELEQELSLIFANDDKISSQRYEDGLQIFSSYKDKNKLTFYGLENKSFNRFFNNTTEKQKVTIVCKNSDFVEKTVSFEILAAARRPVMKIHFKKSQQLKNSIFSAEPLIVGRRTKIRLNDGGNFPLIHSQNIYCDNQLPVLENGQLTWNIEPREAGIAVFKYNDVEQQFDIATPEIDENVLYNLSIGKEEVILKVYVTVEQRKDTVYDFKLIDGISKQNIDYRLATDRHVINVGQKEKRERIIWTTDQDIRSFNIVLNGLTIPVTWADKAAYPTNVGLRNAKTHFINRSVKKDLLIRYVDGAKNDSFILTAGKTDWTYEPVGNFVKWEIFDQQNLVLSQELEYRVEKKPKIKMFFDSSLDSKKTNFLTIKLDWPVKYDVDFELFTDSNSGINLNGRYRLKANSTEMKFKLTPLKLKKRPSFLILQMLSSTLEYEPGRYNIMIN